MLQGEDYKKNFLVSQGTTQSCGLSPLSTLLRSLFAALLWLLLHLACRIQGRRLIPVRVSKVGVGRLRRDYHFISGCLIASDTLKIPPLIPCWVFVSFADRKIGFRCGFGDLYLLFRAFSPVLCSFLVTLGASTRLLAWGLSLGLSVVTLWRESDFF